MMSDEGIARRRFIAGAICPQCSELDKLQCWEEAGIPHRACVRCGYQEAMTVTSTAPVLPAGRLEQRAPATKDIGQPLIFMPRSSLRTENGI